MTAADCDACSGSGRRVDNDLGLFASERDAGPCSECKGDGIARCLCGAVATDGAHCEDCASDLRDDAKRRAACPYCGGGEDAATLRVCWEHEDEPGMGRPVRDAFASRT